MVTPDVLVVGGGWAGSSAALAASCRGAEVVLVEAAPRLGGRASSFLDPATGELLDHGQHLFLGAYRETLDLLEELGTRHLVAIAPRLEVPVLTDEGRLRTLRAAPLPGPLGLAVGLLRFAEAPERAAFLGSLLRLGLAAGPALVASALGRPPRAASRASVADLLAGQDPRLAAVLWEPMVLAALNARPGEARAREFLQALAKGFLRGGRAAALGLPGAPLARLLEPLPARLALQGSRVLTGTMARSLAPARAGRWRLELSGGAVLEAPRVVLALPARRALALLGPAADGVPGLREEARRPESAIVSLWLWSGGPLLPAPLQAFGPQAGAPPEFHWGFSRAVAGSWRTCVVTSAAGDPAGPDPGALERRLAGFLASRGRPYRWDRCRVVRERAATVVFSPGSPPRIPQATPLPGLALAGDWTDTGLPATIEGAVVSGRRAFETLAF